MALVKTKSKISFIPPNHAPGFVDHNFDDPNPSATSYHTRMSTRTLTVVFTDINGYSKRFSKSSRNDLLEYLRKHESVLLPIIVRHDGQVVKTLGDSFLLRFENPTEAARCALVMQHTLAHYNAGVESDDAILIRIGIHTGEVEQIGNDLFGETLHLASRIKDACPPGTACLSEATRLALRQGEVPTVSLGATHLKGISEPTELHLIDRDQDSSAHDQVIIDQTHLIRYHLETPLPHGTYSANLLLATERDEALQRGMGSHERRPLVFAAAVLLVLAIYGAYGVTQLRQQAQLRQAASELRDHNPAGAFALLTDLRRKRPNDPRVVQLLGYSVVMETQALLEELQFQRALERLDEHRQNFPYLTIYDAAERTARISQTQHKVTKQPDAPGETFDQLLLRYPNDMDIRMRQAASMANLNDELGALYAYVDIIESNPEFAKKPIIRQHIEMCLGKYVDPRLQTVVATYLFDALGDALEPHIYSPRETILRRNAFAIFLAKGEEVDPTRFYTMELLNADPRDAQGIDLALRYFEQEVMKGADTSLVANVAIIGQDFPILGIYDGPMADRILAVINTLFAERLRPLLQQFVSNQAKRGHRLNAYRVLNAHEWLSEDLTLSFHLANIADHDPGMAKSYELFSTKWIADEGPGSIREQLVPLLKGTKEDLIATISRLESAGQNDLTSTHRELLTQTERALQRLGN